MRALSPTVFTSDNPSITIIGAGPSAMLTALILAEHKLSCTLVGKASTMKDLRTTTLMQPAIKLLKKLAIWQDIAHEAAPLREMQLVDQTRRLIPAPFISFQAKEVQQDAFGYNIPNQILNQALSNALHQNSAVHIKPHYAKDFLPSASHIQVILDDGSHFLTQFLVGADGKYSRVREKAGIKITSQSKGQTALVLVFSHVLPHNFASREFHTPFGPCTQVPLPGNKSSLIWVMQDQQAEQYLALSRTQLGEKIEEQLQYCLGKITIETPAQSWLLSSFQAEYFAVNNFFLVGEAAHLFPPIGAQGLNLSIRDAQTLAELLSNAKERKESNTNLAKQYNKKRKSDILLRTHAVQQLNNMLLSSSLLSQCARALGLEALRRFPLLRQLFMHEGMEPNSAFRNFFRRNN